MGVVTVSRITIYSLINYSLLLLLIATPISPCISFNSTHFFFRPFSRNFLCAASNMKKHKNHENSFVFASSVVSHIHVFIQSIALSSDKSVTIHYHTSHDITYNTNLLNMDSTYHIGSIHDP